MRASVCHPVFIQGRLLISLRQNFLRWAKMFWIEVANVRNFARGLSEARRMHRGVRDRTAVDSRKM